jgi:hypothetical protein
MGLRPARARRRAQKRPQGPEPMMRGREAAGPPEMGDGRWEMGEGGKLVACSAGEGEGDEDEDEDEDELEGSWR